ncbi:cob(I)yrinic acid a,c-diamide adenosyltransferase [Afifella sp. JA880]|uniref:cob(I)yrinic acid a,c-diamide adenosyltransferase n=1 Tax=Afifella sp. JA880 TaxID=2975280 RepID=UPI0021BA5F64|nr:cob(I)yrinic acid a,c-diamide adenosyltransferase [Afifella sp. JA880]MCT8266369.1 cob(I)yrinic acid a,c-diamide adenosyltransferase [Afifella sp. JA880]
MSVYTKGGDKGETSLLGGLRVPKDSLRVEVYGTLDEATSAMGLGRASCEDDELRGDLHCLQRELIDVMAEVASGFDPDKPRKGKVYRVEPHQVEHLEKLIDAYQEERVPQRGFVTPGGTPAAAALDMARTLVRRGERRLIALGREEEINPVLFKYFNRLSDYLYMAARIDEQRAVVREVTRQIKKAKAEPEEGTMTELCLSDCDRLVEAGIARADAISVPMVLVVVDAAGDLIELRRMKGSLGVSLKLAPHKAYTAAAVRSPTHEIAKLSQPGGPLFGIDSNIPNFTLVGGGLPLERGGRVVGAVGVSGGSVEEDIDVARAMVAAL